MEETDIIEEILKETKEEDLEFEKKDLIDRGINIQHLPQDTRISDLRHVEDTFHKERHIQATTQPQTQTSLVFGPQTQNRVITSFQKKPLPETGFKLAFKTEKNKSAEMIVDELNNEPVKKLWA